VITIVERDLTPTETLLKDAGFAAYAAEHGNPPEVSVRPCIVAVDGTTFAGCAAGRTNNSRRWFYLSDLYVEPAYRGRRVGSQLLAAIEEHAVSLGSERMWVWTAGYEAPGFYAKHGYAVFVEMDGWYSSGHARVGLWKKLRAVQGPSPSSSGTVDGGS
jgi:GNAT superfamily N-acetyltransferase